jgi:hypothetical protein
MKLVTDSTTKGYPNPNSALPSAKPPPSVSMNPNPAFGKIELAELAPFGKHGGPT